MRALIVVGALALGWFLRSVTVPLLLSYFVVLVLLPVREKLAGSMPQLLASSLCLLFVCLVPPLLALPALLELDEFASLLPTQAETEDFGNRLLAQIEGLRAKLPESLSSSLEFEPETIQNLVKQVAAEVAAFGGTVLSFVGGVVGLLSGLLLIPIFTFFLLQGAPWLPKIRQELPEAWHPRFDRILPRIEDIVRSYCTARLLVSAGKGAIYLVILLLAGIPGAFTLSILAGVASLFPVLGPLVAFLFLAVVAFAHGGLVSLLLAVLAYVVAEFAEGYILMPKLVGRGLGLSDFAVIVAVFAGGALLGIFGMAVAVPALAVLKVLYAEYLRPVMTDSAAPEPSG